VNDLTNETQTYLWDDYPNGHNGIGSAGGAVYDCWLRQ
jgi:hypothetical protein